MLNSKNKVLDAYTKKQVAYLRAHTILLRMALEFLSKNRIVVSSDSHRFRPDVKVLQELPFEKLSQILIMKSDLYESIEEEDYSSILENGISDEELSSSLRQYNDENHGLPYLTKKMSDTVFLDYLWILECPDTTASLISTLKNNLWWNMSETLQAA